MKQTTMTTTTITSNNNNNNKNKNDILKKRRKKKKTMSRAEIHECMNKTFQKGHFIAYIWLEYLKNKQLTDDELKRT